MRKLLIRSLAFLLSFALAFLLILLPNENKVFAQTFQKGFLVITNGRDVTDLEVYVSSTDGLYYADVAEAAKICGFDYSPDTKRLYYKIENLTAAEYTLRLNEGEQKLVDKWNLLYACPMIKDKNSKILVSIAHFFPLLFADVFVEEGKVYVLPQKNPLLPLLNALEKGGQAYTYTIEAESGAWVGGARQQMIKAFNLITGFSVDKIIGMADALTPREYQKVFENMIPPLKAYLDALDIEKDDLIEYETLQKYSANKAAQKGVKEISKTISQGSKFYRKYDDVLAKSKLFSPETDKAVKQLSDKTKQVAAVKYGSMSVKIVEQVFEARIYALRLAMAFEDHVRMLDAVYPSNVKSQRGQSARKVYQTYKTAYQKDLVKILIGFTYNVDKLLYNEGTSFIMGEIVGQEALLAVKFGGFIVDVLTRINTPTFSSGTEKMGKYSGYRKIAEDATAVWMKASTFSSKAELEKARLAAILTALANRELFDAEYKMAENNSSLVSVASSAKARMDNIDRLLIALYRAHIGIDNCLRPQVIKRQEAFVKEVSQQNKQQFLHTAPIPVLPVVENTAAEILRGKSWAFIEPFENDHYMRSNWPGIEVLDFADNGQGRHFSETKPNNSQDIFASLNNERESSPFSWRFDGKKLDITINYRPMQVEDMEAKATRMITPKPLTVSCLYDSTKKCFYYADSKTLALIALPEIHELTYSSGPLKNVHHGFYTKFGYVILKIPREFYESYQVNGPYTQSKKDKKLEYWEVTYFGGKYQELFIVGTLKNMQLQGKKADYKILYQLNHEVVFLERPLKAASSKGDKELKALIAAVDKIWASSTFMPGSFSYKISYPYKGNKAWFK